MVFDKQNRARKLVYKLAGALAAVFLCLLGLTGGYLAERWQFIHLTVVSEDTEKAKQLASSLRKTQRGVQLALNDMNCYGGKTRGWSSWILETSPLSSEVLGNLKKIAGDSGEGLPRQIEATLILWSRTREPVWLGKCFQLVQHAGGPTVAMGRKRMLSIFDFGELRSRLDVPANENLNLSFREFSEFTNVQAIKISTNEGGTSQ